MSIWNKILIGFVFLAAAAFGYLAIRTLKTHQYWRQLAQGFENTIEEVKQENDDLLNANEKTRETEDEDKIAWGIKRLRLELHKIYLDRGRVWENADPQPVDRETGQVVVGTELPDPHGITPKMVLYVFEQRDGAGDPDYLGEFKVTDVAERQVQLQPTMALTQEELTRLAGAGSPWILYEKMPVDRHKLFAPYDEDQLREMLPESTVMDYIKDGEPATWADVADWGVHGDVVDEEGVPLVDAEGRPQQGVQGTFRRRLRDYELIFQDHVVKRVEYVDLIAAAQRDAQYIQTAHADAVQQQQYREKQKGELQAKLDELLAERAAILKHEQALRASIAAYGQALEQVLASNQATASRIADIQLEAARRINVRTPPVASGAAAGN